MPRSLLVVLSLLVTCAYGSDQVERRDFFVRGDEGMRIFVREVVAVTHTDKAAPVLLIHGARVPGIASFDLQVPNGSLAADLAKRGLIVYVMDVRGYGASTRPKEMEGPAEGKPALVRSNDAVRDIASVVDWICQRRHARKVALFGWATGGQWAGYYASMYPDRAAELVMLNSLYGGSSAHPLMGHGSDMEDPNHPGRFNSKACGSYRLNDEKSLFGVWNRSILLENKDEWRDPQIARSYASTALASDPTSSKRNPPSFRSPCGALEDSFYLATGHQLWDASLITSPTLVLASERDFWSRPQDRELLQEHLTHSHRVKVVVLKDATHFVHLDRPERGRDLLLKEVVGFLTGQ
jgi:pimeloyl-ACP methyl ester carboxylesterase